MEEIIYFVRYAEHAQALSNTLKALANDLLKARSATDLENIGCQLVECVRGIAEQAKRQRAATLVYMTGRPGGQQECLAHGYIPESNCFTCQRLQYGVVMR